MELELPTQRNCLARLTPQTFGILKPGKATFALGLSNAVSQRPVCKDDKKADMMATELKIKNAVRICVIFVLSAPMAMTSS